MEPIKREELERRFLDRLFLVGIFPPREDGIYSGGEPHRITGTLNHVEYRRLYEQNVPRLHSLLTSADPLLPKVALTIYRGHQFLELEYTRLEQGEPE